MGKAFDVESRSESTQNIADAYLNADLNARLIVDKAATYLPFAPDNGIDGIQFKDLLIVRRSIKPLVGNVIFAEIDGQYCLRRLQKDGGKLFLVDDKGFIPPRVVTSSEFYHGTVTHSIRCHYF